MCCGEFVSSFAARLRKNFGRAVCGDSSWTCALIALTITGRQFRVMPRNLPQSEAAPNRVSHFPQRGFHFVSQNQQSSAEPDQRERRHREISQRTMLP